jgi:hypothetical protein
VTLESDGLTAAEAKSRCPWPVRTPSAALTVSLRDYPLGMYRSVG